MSNPFTSEEQEILRDHGIAIYAKRIIFDAQPPMSEARIAAVQAHCAGQLPAALVCLWRLTAGGRMDYDLSISMDGNEEAISWNELFYDGSDAYRDLQGWIEHEEECATEAAESRNEVWRGKLEYLPFGGFEYCDRIYAVVAAGDDHGEIVAWKQGLPGWTHALQEDAVATVAADLPGAFAMLCLNNDPRHAQDYCAGQDFLGYVYERVEEHGMDRALADRLIDYYLQALADWRTPLATGTLQHTPRLGKIAIGHAIDIDDAGLIEEIHANGISLTDVQTGSATPLEVAVRQGAFATAHAIVKVGVPIPADIFHRIDKAIPAELVADLLAHGAAADAQGLAHCVACGTPDAARLIASHAVIDAEYEKARSALLQRYEKDLKQVRAGTLGHYLGEAGLAERVDRLKNFTF